jgi:hypothetical protein
MDLEQTALNVHLITCRLLRPLPLWLLRLIEWTIAAAAVLSFALICGLHFQHVVLHHGSACFDDVSPALDPLPDILEVRNAGVSCSGTMLPLSRCSARRFGTCNIVSALRV